MSNVKERPILFSAPMVRAILEGRKTVTRRAIKVQPHIDASGNFCVGRYNYGQDGDGKPVTKHFVKDCCPYGKPGDRLWVRETFMDLLGTGVEHRPTIDSPVQRYCYSADVRPGSFADETRKDYGLRWKPSIHMPRAASRILLEITDVRVERLQDISDEQAKAEGVQRGPLREWCGSDEGGAWHKYPVPAFRNLWQSTGGDWDANPCVWVVEFERIQP
ncbi:hypothetical protein [Pseudomonas corrugata]